MGFPDCMQTEFLGICLIKYHQVMTIKIKPEVIPRLIMLCRGVWQNGTKGSQCQAKIKIIWMEAFYDFDSQPLWFNMERKNTHSMSLIFLMRQQGFKSWMDKTDMASRFSFSFNIRHMQVIFVVLDWQMHPFEKTCNGKLARQWRNTMCSAKANFVSVSFHNDIKWIGNKSTEVTGIMII